MSDFENRRRQAAIRAGHVVAKKDGRRFRVFQVYDFSKQVCLEPLDELEEYEGNNESPRNLLLSPDEITEEDKREMARREQFRRAEFAKTLSPLLRTYTLDRMDVHAGNRAAFEACRDLEHGMTLFIHGHAGNGKTMLAVATAHHFAPYYSVAVWSVVELFSAIRASFNSHAHVERPNLKTPELLVLDDIGKSKASDFIYEELYGLINYRLERSLTTVFTSNHSVWDAAMKVSPDPDNLAALVSRLASGAVVKVMGPDRRILRGEVLPLQILFSAAFFVSVGLLLDLAFLVQNLPLVLRCHRRGAAPQSAARGRERAHPGVQPRDDGGLGAPARAGR